MCDNKEGRFNDNKYQFMRDRAEELARSRQETNYQKKLADRDKLLQELHVHQIELEMQNEELRQAQAKLHYTHQQYLDLYNEAPMGYASLDDNGIIIRANQMLANMLGVEKCALNGRALAEYMLPQDQAVFRSRFSAFANQPQGKHIDVRFKQGQEKNNVNCLVGRIQGRRLDKNNNAAGSVKWAETLLIVISDVSELVKSEERMHYQAYQDLSTGLPNRLVLFGQLENSLSLAMRQHSYGALIAMGFDRFKDIVDSLGHQVGDLVCVELSKRLRKIIRKEDLLVRLNGDEYAVLLAEQHHNKDHIAVNALGFVEHITESLIEPILAQGSLIQLSLNTGITLFPFHQEDTVNDIIHQAVKAMYLARSNGCKPARFFHDSMRGETRI